MVAKVLLPDINSWLVNGLVDFFKLIKNEFGLSLWDALNEFVEYHAFYCAYTGLSDIKDLILYPLLTYNHHEKRAKLSKLFFVSSKINHILVWNYLLKIDKNKKRSLKNKNNVFGGDDEEMPGLNFFAEFNELELVDAKEILLQHSYQRENLQQLILIENQNNDFDYDIIDETIIKVDLSFLQECSFLQLSRYKNFKFLLSPNLIIELPYKLDIVAKKIPPQLKAEQLIDLTKLKR